MSVLLRMADLHESVGNAKGARMIAEYILQQQPEHAGAQALAARLQPQGSSSN
jgi:hypothetical protein